MSNKVSHKIRFNRRPLFLQGPHFITKKLFMTTLTIIIIGAIIFLVKLCAFSSKQDYSVNWDKVPKWNGVIKIKSIALPDDMHDSENEWQAHIRAELKNLQN